MSTRTHKFGRQSGADDDGYDYGASGYDSYWKNLAAGGGGGDQDEDDDDYESEDDEEDDDDDDEEEEEEEDEEEEEPEVADKIHSLSLGAGADSGK